MSSEVVLALSPAGMPTAGALAAYKLFGPSLAAFGGNLGRWTDRWSAGFLGITDRASTKLGDKIDAPGEVPPRILQRVMTDGAWCDDDVAQDYFAGLVAGSRSINGEDDENLAAANLLSGLRARDIRLHYLIYSSIRQGLMGGWQLGVSAGRNAAQLYLPDQAVASVLQMSLKDAHRMAPAIIATLARNDLIADAPWAWGEPKSIAEALISKGWDPPAPGLVVTPSWAGIDLALRADASGFDVSDFLYATGWEQLAVEVPVNGQIAAFPSAPKTQQGLTSLRERAGHTGDAPGVGWAIADLPPEE